MPARSDAPHCGQNFGGSTRIGWPQHSQNFADRTRVPQRSQVTSDGTGAGRNSGCAACSGVDDGTGACLAGMDGAGGWTADDSN